jgi:hypothetical protein
MTVLTPGDAVDVPAVDPPVDPLGVVVGAAAASADGARLAGRPEATMVGAVVVADIVVVAVAAVAFVTMPADVTTLVDVLAIFGVGCPDDEPVGFRVERVALAGSSFTDESEFTFLFSSNSCRRSASHELQSSKSPLPIVTVLSFR